MNFINTILFISIVAILIIIGLINTKKVKQEDQYLFAGRKTRLFALVATLVMTEFNTATLIAFSSAGYYASWWALSLPCVFLFGLLFYAVSVARHWKLFNGNSVMDYFTLRYGRDVGIFAAIILFCAMAGFSATYVKALTMIFVPLLPQINAWQLSAALVLVIFAMTWRGGLVAIIRTDLISFLMVLFFFPLLLLYTWHLPSNPNPITVLTLHQMQQSLPPAFIFSLILLTMFSYILAPWYGQKIISAASPAIATSAVAIAAVFVFVLYGLGISITSILATKMITKIAPEAALPYAIKYALPATWQGLGYGVLFLTAATTLAGIWSAMVTLLIGCHASQNYSLKRSRLLTVSCAILSYFLANSFIDHVFNKMILANIPVVALSFALLAGFYWEKADRRAVYCSVIIGFLWGLGCYCYFGEQHLYTWYWAVYGIPLIFISGTIVTLRNKIKLR